jgi:hypothetical protein
VVGADGASYVDVYDGTSPATKLYRVTRLGRRARRRAPPPENLEHHG